MKVEELTFGCKLFDKGEGERKENKVHFDRLHKGIYHGDAMIKDCGLTISTANMACNMLSSSRSRSAFLCNCWTACTASPSSFLISRKSGKSRSFCRPFRVSKHFLSLLALKTKVSKKWWFCLLFDVPCIFHSKKQNESLNLSPLAAIRLVLLYLLDNVVLFRFLDG